MFCNNAFITCQRKKGLLRVSCCYLTFKGKVVNMKKVQQKLAPGKLFHESLEVVVGCPSGEFSMLSYS